MNNLDLKVEEVTARCLKCGAEYNYAAASLYKPRTCMEFNCVWKQNHPEVERAKKEATNERD